MLNGGFTVAAYFIIKMNGFALLSQKKEVKEKANMIFHLLSNGRIY